MMGGGFGALGIYRGSIPRACETANASRGVVDRRPGYSDSNSR